MHPLAAYLKELRDIRLSGGGVKALESTDSSAAFCDSVHLNAGAD